MRFTLFHLMPYADLDMSFTDKYDSAWTTLPNSYYDPKKGAKLYNRYLDELEYAEELGYDILAVNEHHQNAYGIMPSPIVTASALARRTKRVEIAIMGSAIPLRDHPLTIAEEHSMIDNITEGRLITGFVRGIGAEYHSWGVSPAQSHERFHEAHDLIIQAWTRPGPFEFEGKHYHFQYVNVWPRPYRQPHPPIWIPSQGSQETIEWASHPSRRYMYCQTFSPWKTVQFFMNMYRETAARQGWEPGGDRLGWLLPIYVGETDASAMKEAKVHFENFRNKFLRMPIEMLLPPGYLSLSSHQRVVTSKKHLSRDMTAEEANEDGLIVVGDKNTVRERIEFYYKEIGLENLLCLHQFGTLPGDLTRANMERFARDVMPHLRPLAGKPTEMPAAPVYADAAE
jgi:alkanesulfonate monooxygenase SsuD/methylene tetrahydromethanopterin reductase-like flavin-dependent oxidoreductase (luciferase family)